MSLVVGTNTSAQFAQDALRANQHKTATAMQRLSTGLRINSARDDAAGLAISQSMTSQIRGLNQAVRNINDAVNMLQTAEGGLSSISDMLQRMRELAVQSANGTNSDAQRAYLQKEAAALKDQIGKIVDTTTWNDKTLLDGSFIGQSVQVGANTGATMDLTIPTTIGSSVQTVTNTVTTTTSTPNIFGAQANNVPGTGAALSGSMNIINMDGTVATTIPITSTGTAKVQSIATTSDGSVYVVGTENGTMNSQINHGANDLFLSKYQYDGTLLWSKLIGGAGNETAYSVTTDSTGNAILTGYAANAGTTLQADGYANLNTSDSSVDVFIAKYSSSGTQQWQQTIAGSNGAEVGNQVKVDSNNNIYISGITNSNTFNGQATSGGQDGFLMKLDTNGNISWTKLLGTAANDRVMNFTIGSDNAIYSVGSLDNNAISPAVVKKISSGGIVQWTQDYSTPQWSSLNSITQGSDGNLYVAGTTQGAMDGQNYVSGSSGGWNTFIGKLTTNGVKIWTKEYSPNLIASSVSQIAFGPDGNLYLAGSTSDSIAGSTAQGAVDATLAKIGADGSVIWSHLLGDSNDNGLNGIAFYTTTTSTSTTTISQVNLPSLTVDISTQVGASSAIDLIDNKIEAVNGVRSTIGIYINRLNYAGDNATNISTNLTASRSAIQDTDYAEESANLAKSQIVQQAATAMLVQANQQPQSVLALLKNL